MISSQRNSGFLSITLALSAVFHLAILAISPEPPATTAARSGHGGISLQLVAANTPPTGRVNRREGVANETGHSGKRTVTTPDSPVPVQHVVTTAEKEGAVIVTTPREMMALPLAGTQAALQDAELNNALHTQVRRAMQPYFNYPLLARRRGWQGTVRVGLRIMADGHISRLHIVDASHYPLLDRAALDSLGSIKSIPDAVAWLGGRHSDIVLPVEYRLTDS